MNSIKLWAGLAALVLASHSMNASAQSSTYESITSSVGQTVSIAVDSTTNMLWYAFDSYKDGLAQGFRLATLDDLKAYNQSENSFNRLVPGMKLLTSFGPWSDKTYEYQTAYAYLMNGTELSQLGIFKTFLYYCDSRFNSPQQCKEAPTTVSGVSMVYGDASLDHPDTYSGNFGSAVIPVAMVREMAPVPEPESAGLALVGLLAGGWMVRRRQAQG